MTFTFPLLAAIGAALAVVPIVIHLLNRRRRRRVAWAAMDFLLQSDRKNRTWVQLSEWLLLAARVLAIALVGLLTATPRTADLLDDFFGGERARHIVLLDDTCSMSQRDAGTSAWGEATMALKRLKTMASTNGDEVIAVRYTDALAERDPSLITAEGSVGENLAAWEVSYLGVKPTRGLEQVERLFDEASGSAKTYAYVFSDFAETSHGDRDGWGTGLRRLAEQATDLVLATCGDPTAGNLAITKLSLAPGPVAAGVETELVIEVTNFSNQPAPPVAVSIERNGQPLTAIEVGEIEPGDRRVVEEPITLEGIGLHVIDASLPDDRLAADNRRWLAVDVAASQPVLLVNSTEQQIESRVFAAALRPRGKTRSGWAPMRVNQLDAETLSEAAVVCLLDVERLSTEEREQLREFVADGGGLLMVLGPRTDADEFNRSLAGPGVDGAPPLVGWQLGPPTSGPVVVPGQPMLAIEDHPALRVLGGEQNGFLPLVRVLVRRRLADQEETTQVQNVSTQREPDYAVLASFNDGQPLVLENRYGKGRVIGLLTTAATGGRTTPPWSNLATLPIFPIMANDVVGWLAQERLAPPSEIVGTGRFADPPERSTLRRWDESGELRETAGVADSLTLTPAEPGVYRRVLGGIEGETFAAVIDAAESDLAAPDTAALQSRWDDVARVGRASELFREEVTPESRAPYYIAAALLLGLLVGERWLAYKTSYVNTGVAPTKRRNRQ